MAGYVIADVSVKDAAGFEEYRKLVPATVQKYGGKFLVLEFPSLAEARRWYFSDEYKPAKEMRFRTALSNLLIVEGA